MNSVGLNCWKHYGVMTLIRLDQTNSVKVLIGGKEYKEFGIGKRREARWRSELGWT